ncbi:hypothetical protein RPMA_12550 [Tardiphaga alba]|uniref:Uncharacterized protein n=1 Tax=Tardiphaga alba TaxID=340268 RepID=A0ABX8ACN3_9BRAD|nr:hypothetical protein [Tardiphaga alba]QUS39575.1 hypothetical protein RPMA_12550 [Tardiphaga alba]
MTPRRLADRMASRHARLTGDGYVRETFTLPRDAARAKAREILERYPAGGYSTTVEFWRQLEDGQIEFTMRRLPTAD